jgi:signal transduction histidine kinase
MTAPLKRTWLRLTAWYVAVFGVVLTAFGAGLYIVVTREIETAIDRGLRLAVDQAGRALEIREQERAIAAEELVDALDELHVPGHDLYVFDGDAGAIRPHQAPDWVSAAAAEALEGAAFLRTMRSTERAWRFYARAFDIAGTRYAAVAVAEALQVDRQYPDLIRAFLLAGLASLVLVALGGSLLARKSLVPVQRSMDLMRRFVADASHELRTPAAVLQSAAEVGLQRPHSEQEYVSLLTTIREESERFGRLVEGLLLLASADDGKLRIRSERVFLDDLLVDASVAAKTLAARKGVSIRVGSFEEAPVIADPVLLRQVLLIILDNAIKFSSAGGVVECSVSVHGTRARACVRDSGPGIPAESLPHVFERFYRADASRTMGGAGIGLSIASVIADAHHATIQIESTVGIGTTVCVELPLVHASREQRSPAAVP